MGTDGIRTRFEVEGDDAYRFNRNAECPYASEPERGLWRAGFEACRQRLAKLDRDMYGPIGPMIDALDVGDDLKKVLGRVATAAGVDLDVWYRP